MRRLMTGFSLAAIVILGGIVGACQPTKPCHCVQSGGCRCPLPPPDKKAPVPQGQLGQTQTTGETQFAQHMRHAHRHEARRYPHAPWREAEAGHRHGWRHHRETWLAEHRARSSEHEAWGEDREERGNTEDHESLTMRHRRHVHHLHEPPSSRSGGALSYDYRSLSRSYRLGEYAPPRSRFAMQDGAGFIEDRFDYRAHRHPAERDHGAAASYDERYGVPDVDEEAYDASPAYSQPAQMSVNAPGALDPWNGYGVECHDRNDE
jgi:hypothetical protein